MQIALALPAGDRAEPLHGAGDPATRERLVRFAVEAMEVARTGEVVGGRGRGSEEDPREEQEDRGGGAGSRQRILSP